MPRRGKEEMRRKEKATVSGDSDAIVHKDSSDSEVEETTDTFEGSTSFCAKCLTIFSGKEIESAIGCITPYCR